MFSCIYYSILFIFLLSFVASEEKFRINIGSCHDLRRVKSPKEYRIWDRIRERNGDKFIWGGDNIYADTLNYSQLVIDSGHYYRGAPEDLKRIYKATEKVPEYKRFVETIGQENIYGTWDDHDFGLNNAGIEYEFRKESQKAFLDFFKVPMNSPRRQLEGVYNSALVNEGRVHIVLLDNRYHKDLYTNKTGDFLGEEQWTWFENELNSQPPTVKVTLIVSGLQVLPDDVLRSRFGETWAKLPLSRERLVETIASSKANAPIIISGDVHCSEFLLAKCSSETENFLIPELTTSGLTHSWVDYPTPMPQTMQIVHKVARSPYQIQERFYLDRNFGEIDFSLGMKDESVTLKIFRQNGELFHAENFKLRQLKRKNQSVHQCVGHNFKEENTRMIESALAIACIALCFIITPLALAVVLTIVGIRMLRKNIKTKLE